MSSYEEVVVADFFELKKNPPHDKTIRIYNKKRKGRHRPTVDHPTKHRYSNNDLATMIANLSKRMDAGFKQVNARIDYIVKSNNLKDLPKKNKK